MESQTNFIQIEWLYLFIRLILWINRRLTPSHTLTHSVIREFRCRCMDGLLMNVSRKHVFFCGICVDLIELIEIGAGSINMLHRLQLINTFCFDSYRNQLGDTR